MPDGIIKIAQKSSQTNNIRVKPISRKPETEINKTIRPNIIIRGPNKYKTRGQ